MLLGGVLKKLDFLGTCPISGGVHPPPAEKFRFFQTKSKKYSACKFSVTPCLSIGSNKIFIKKGEKKLGFFLPKWEGGQSLGDMSPKNKKICLRPP